MNLEEKNTNIKFNILAIVCIILFSFALSPVALQNDTFYTIRIGEHIINNGIDMQDPFSWHEDLPYTYPHWAYDTATYLIYNLGEMTGIADGGMLFIYISTAILSCILGALVYITASKVSKNKLLSFFLTIFVMYLMKDFIAARAQLVTFILFVLTILFIENFLESKKKRYLVGLVIISIIIANVHVAVWPFFFILFLPYVAEYIIAKILDANPVSKFVEFYYKDRIKNIERKIKKEKDETKRNVLLQKLEEEKKISILSKEKENKIIEKSKQRRENPYKLKITKNNAAKWLILIMVICALTGFLTPLGDTPYTYLVKTMQGNTTKSISEHLPLTLFDEKDVMTVVILILAILIFTDVKIKLSDFFMVGGLLFLTFMSRRQASMLILIGGFVFIKWISSLIKKYDADGTLKFMKLMTSLLGKIITITLVILMSFVMIKPKLKENFINEKKYPVEAATWILDNLDIENMRLFNEYNYGSYLLYRGIPVFIDSRADLYAPEFNKGDNEEGRDIFSDYITTSSIGAYYETKFEKYNITHVIVVNNAKLNMFLSRDEKYEQLYKDDIFVIYERNV